MEQDTIADIQEIHEQKLNEFCDRSNFKNQDDISGIEGFVGLQNQEIEAIKQKTSQSNKDYLENHPELRKMLEIYTIKLLDQQPKDVLTFTGNFFSKFFKKRTPRRSGKNRRAALFFIKFKSGGNKK